MPFRSPPLGRSIAALALVAALPLAGCTVNPATGKSSFTAFMSPAEELEIGRREHAKILKRYGVYADGAFTGYVTELGLAVGRVSEVAGYPFTVTVLNDESVNAFAVPGGNVYVNRGLLALAESEAEVVGVLAHEVGHVVARHAAQRYSQAMAASFGLTLLDVVAQVAGAPSGAGNLAGLGAELYLQSYSRDQELEADMLAIRYMTRLGYAPEAMISMFQKLERHRRLEAAAAGRPEAEPSSLFSTHPRTEERIRQAIQLAGQATPDAARTGREAYLSRLDGLLFGDDPKEGVRKGRTFAHPALGIAFTVPPGYTLYNLPAQVLARGPQGALIVFDMERPERARAAGDLRRYLVASWEGRTRLGDVEAIDVNGMAAATGRGRISGRDGTMDVRPVVIRDRDDRLFRIVFLTPPSRTQAEAAELQRTTFSFRRLSPDEAAAIRPWRVRVVMVGTGDTADSLAERMPFERFRREWFEALNGLPPGAPVAQGKLVKIVAE